MPERTLKTLHMDDYEAYKDAYYAHERMQQKAQEAYRDVVEAQDRMDAVHREFGDGPSTEVTYTTTEVKSMLMEICVWGDMPKEYVRKRAGEDVDSGGDR